MAPIRLHTHARIKIFEQLVAVVVAVVDAAVVTVVIVVVSAVAFVVVAAVGVDVVVSHPKQRHFLLSKVNSASHSTSTRGLLNCHSFELETLNIVIILLFIAAQVRANIFEDESSKLYPNKQKVLPTKVVGFVQFFFIEGYFLLESVKGD